jgi:hypothetical protein
MTTPAISTRWSAAPMVRKFISLSSPPAAALRHCGAPR